MMNAVKQATKTDHWGETPVKCDGEKATEQDSSPSNAPSSDFSDSTCFDDLVYCRRIEREAFAMLSAFRKGSLISDAFESTFQGSNLAEEHQTIKKSRSNSLMPYSSAGSGEPFGARSLGLL